MRLDCLYTIHHYKHRHILPTTSCNYFELTITYAHGTSTSRTDGRLTIAIYNKKAVLSQRNRAMP